MKIDIKTLLLVIGISTFLQAFVLYTQFIINKKYRGLGFWALGSFMIGFAYILYILRDVIPSPIIAIILPNVLQISGGLLLYIGIRKFFNQKENLKTIILFFSVFLGFYGYYTYVNNDINIRNLCMDIAVSIIFLFITISLFSNKINSISGSVKFLIAVILSNICFYAILGISIILKLTYINNLFEPTFFRTGTFITYLVSGFLYTFGLVIMVNQRLNAEVNETKENLQLVFNTSAEAVSITSLIDGNIIDINKGYTDILGFNREDVIGKSTIEVNIWVNIDDRKKFVSILEEKGLCENIEFLLQRKDGSQLIGLVSARIINLQGVPHIISETHDITENARAKEVLAKGEELYRLITENVNDMISKHTLDGRFTFLSPSCKKILGYDPEELIGVNPYDLLHPENIEFIRNSHDILLKSKENYITTYRILCKNGSYVWLETSNNTIMDQHTNEPVEILCVSRDITQKKEEEILLKNMVIFAEELLRTGSEKVTYQKILENLVYISNAKYAILNLNSGKNNKLTTVAIAGDLSRITEITSILGFEVVGREWDDDSVKSEIINHQIVTHFSSISKLVGKVLPNFVISTIEKLFDIGEVTVTKIIVNNKIIGDFTLIMTKGDKFENDYLVEMYSRQIDMFITRIKDEEAIEYISYHDALTGLYNRRKFEIELDNIYKSGIYPVAIIMGDINGLKLVNDAFGHTKGDEILKKISEIIKAECSVNSYAARHGGDEFAIILVGSNYYEASLIVENITRHCLKETTNEIILNISFGIGVKLNADDDLIKSYHLAEERMYASKLLDSKSTRSTIIANLRSVMEEKTGETRKHCERMAEMAGIIGKKLVLQNHEIEALKLLALLHDIGKTGIPDYILLKPSELNDNEIKIINKHCEIGYRIANTMPELVPIADGILCHHERWDGNGYPQGLVGEDIPLMARIVSILDAFDAMTNNRAYRKALSVEEAVEEIKRCSGTQFDSNIAKIFIKRVLCKHW